MENNGIDFQGLVEKMPKADRAVFAETVWKAIKDTPEYRALVWKNRQELHVGEGGKLNLEVTAPSPPDAHNPPNISERVIGINAVDYDNRTQLGVDRVKLEESAKLMLEAIGEDPSRDGLKETPKRFANYWADIMNGHFLKPEDYVTEFDNDGAYDGAVVVKDLPFYTVCEHHLAPFIGTWDVAYKPGDRIIGLSKLVRIARVFQKRPQVQERLTKQISDALNEILKPEWVVVRMEAEHFCMSTRGVRTPGSTTETMTGHGDYPKDVFNV